MGTDDAAIAYIRNLCSGLTEEQLADAESAFNNLDVLFRKVIQVDVTHDHIPALEGHLVIVSTATLDLMQHAPYLGSEPIVALRNCLYQMFLFGVEVGKVGWPLKKYTCEEAHRHD